MLPVSEADPEVKAAVAKITDVCRCRAEYRRAWKGHADDEHDEHCNYHLFGEDIANLVRDNRHLRDTLQRIYDKSRKAPK